ncbi:hypothetical protein ADL35_18640, partial [Streptomyces sp. NRRL WC-3753]
MAEGAAEVLPRQRVLVGGEALPAELAQVVGWMAADLDMAGQSERHLLAALRSARIAGDRALAAYVISCLSYRFTWSGQGREALRLIQIARKGTQDEAPGPGQALL